MPRDCLSERHSFLCRWLRFHLRTVPACSEHFNKRRSFLCFGLWCHSTCAVGAGIVLEKLMTMEYSTGKFTASGFAILGSRLLSFAVSAVRQRLCRRFQLPSQLRQRLCRAFPLPSQLRQCIRLVIPLSSQLEQCLCPVFPLPFAAVTLPLPRVSTGWLRHVGPAWSDTCLSPTCAVITAFQCRSATFITDFPLPYLDLPLPLSPPSALFSPPFCRAFSPPCLTKARALSSLQLAADGLHRVAFYKFSYTS